MTRLVETYKANMKQSFIYYRSSAIISFLGSKYINYWLLLNVIFLLQINILWIRDWLDWITWISLTTHFLVSSYQSNSRATFPLNNCQLICFQTETTSHHRNFSQNRMNYFNICILSNVRSLTQNYANGGMPSQVEQLF